MSVQFQMIEGRDGLYAWTATLPDGKRYRVTEDTTTGEITVATTRRTLVSEPTIAGPIAEALRARRKAPASPTEDAIEQAMREHRQRHFKVSSTPAREEIRTFEGERTYRISYNGRQEAAVLSLAPHEARQLFDQLSADFGFIQLRKPLTMLQGRPVFEGDTLYSRIGERMVALAGERGFELNMLCSSADEPRMHLWATDTHKDGEPLLFWTNPKDAK
ncbi:hypothetical protein [Cupriavidus pauculus]|uniref:hypothetical protein n=1 Tax=Cupriavidus pauculus TaxID=82633 RepID=UPI001D0C5531|nr:hypothetical protein [Cupriavidus pauculus]